MQLNGQRGGGNTGAGAQKDIGGPRGCEGEVGSPGWEKGREKVKVGWQDA